MKNSSVLFLILAIFMVGAVMAGCTTPQSVTEEPTESIIVEDKTTPEPEAEKIEDELNDVEAEENESITGETYKIGFTYLPTTDTLSAAFHKALDYTAAQFGCEMVYGEMSTGTTEEILAIYENHVQAGVDAYITVSTPAAAIELFDNNQVYFVVGGNTIDDPDALAQALESDYYCGSIMADEVESGYLMCEKIYNAGARNIAYVAFPMGLAKSHDDRVRGIEKFVEEHPDMTIATSYRGIDWYASTAPIDEMLAAFPEIDGLLATGGTVTVPAAVYAAGRQSDIKCAFIDIQEGVDQWFEDGFMVGCAGGQYPVMQMSFIALYESLSTGDMLIADRSKPVNGPYMWITSNEEYNNYVKYMDGDIPAYTGEELKDICGYFNSEVSLEERQQIFIDTWGGYSLEDVISRHEKLF